MHGCLLGRTTNLFLAGEGHGGGGAPAAAAAGGRVPPPHHPPLVFQMNSMDVVIHEMDDMLLAK